jgi:pyruvate, water dikinase
VKTAQHSRTAIVFGLAAACAAFVACTKSPTDSPEDKEWACVLDTVDNPKSSPTIGCRDDFSALASEPLDASIPGAMSMKTVIDLVDDSTLYFQNSKTYKVHYDFISANLSGNGKPAVQRLAVFNETEYYSANRRFILGAVTYFQGPKVWTYEIAPYDKASAAMIAAAMRKISAAGYFGDSLYFHPTSLAVAAEAAKLPASIKMISTDSLYAGIDYQPLNFGTSYGRLIFTTAKKLETEYVSFRDIVVLDAVPNDISVTSGIITQEFQTPLSHINVLSQNRGTPNMALKGAYTDSNLVALKNKWVKFTVGTQNYSVTEVSQDSADAWWDANRPAAVGVPGLNLDVKVMTDIEDILNMSSTGLGLAAELKKAIPAFGGKASHFAGFPHMDTSKVRSHDAFAIPVYFYWQFMEKHGFNDTLAAMLEDAQFKADPAVRDARLKALRNAMKAAPVDSAFEADLMLKLRTDYPGINRIRFRSSTNAEDLDGFTGAGLYDSKTGDMEDPNDPILEAVREVWASVWFFRAFEERSYRNIDHKSVGMALLVHPASPAEEANGVAITNNPFDPSGLEPGYYINVQVGEEPVVSPDASITADQFIYHFEMPEQPIVFIAKSSLTPPGTTVLTAAQTYSLGVALEEVHRFFKAAYGTDASKWFAMDTEFKLDQPAGSDPNAPPIIIMKQARPYPGFGSR